MKEYISTYIKQVEEFMKVEHGAAEYQKLLGEFETKINHFQHERLIHLIVTVLFALLEMSSIYVILVAPNLGAIVFSIMFLILLVPYVMHYYFLENSVQKMYTIRDRIISELERLTDKA